MSTTPIIRIRYQVGEAWKGVYKSDVEYGLANVVQDDEQLSVYRSLKSGNVGHPLTDMEWWFCIIEMKSIKQLNDTIKDDEDARVRAEQDRAAAEGQRAQAETSRAAAERDRAAAETGRSEAEAQRVLDEAQRAGNEESRNAAESTRVSNESSRNSAETGRAGAESNREAAESNRAVAENNRAGAEADRVSAEAARVLAEASRVLAEQGRVSAEDARVLAEAGRVLAEERREIAKAAMVEATGRANAASEGAEKVNASLDGTVLYVKDRDGFVNSVDTKGETGAKGEKGDNLDYSTMTDEEKAELSVKVLQKVTDENILGPTYDAENEAIIYPISSKVNYDPTTATINLG